GADGWSAGAVILGRIVNIDADRVIGQARVHGDTIIIAVAVVVGIRPVGIDGAEAAIILIAIQPLGVIGVAVGIEGGRAINRSPEVLRVGDRAVRAASAIERVGGQMGGGPDRRRVADAEIVVGAAQADG